MLEACWDGWKLDQVIFDTLPMITANFSFLISHSMLHSLYAYRH